MGFENYFSCGTGKWEAIHDPLFPDHWKHGWPLVWLWSESHGPWTSIIQFFLLTILKHNLPRTKQPTPQASLVLTSHLLFYYRGSCALLQNFEVGVAHIRYILFEYLVHVIFLIYYCVCFNAADWVKCATWEVVSKAPLLVRGKDAPE